MGAVDPLGPAGARDDKLINEWQRACSVAEHALLCGFECSR